MDDLISRSAAIDAIAEIVSSMSVCLSIDECHGMKRMQGLAVKALEQLPSTQTDLITKMQNGIKATDADDAYSCGMRNGMRWCISLIDGKEPLYENCPSAQPEIIFCKDCKHSKHWYRDRRRCFLWSENGVSVFDDGFCNYAERRGE